MSGSEHHDGANRSPRSGHTLAWVVIAVAAVAAGTVLGARHSHRIARWLPSLAAEGEPRAESTAQRPHTLWTCGMHPQVIQEQPGLCPICHMKLIPVKAGDSAGSDAPAGSAPGPSRSGTTLSIDPVVVQNMGIRVAPVEQRALVRTVRAVGELVEAEPAAHDVTLRVSGWIRRLHANTEGMHVREGEPLFEIYSRELDVAVGELIGARRARDDAKGAGSAGERQTAERLHASAQRKLEALGLPAREVAALAELPQPPSAVVFRSPVSGHVTKKEVVEGAFVESGARVFTIVDHSTLWVDAQVFEQDLPFVRLGQKATATLTARPGEHFDGQVVFIHPHVDMMTHAATVRFTVPNPDLALRPGMFAGVTLDASVAERAIAVPREAVIDTGTRQLAFVARQGGRFEPRQVAMGRTSDDGFVEILEGLVPGEVVVTSGQFLLDSESRLREAIDKFLNEKAS